MKSKFMIASVFISLSLAACGTQKESTETQGGSCTESDTIACGPFTQEIIKLCQEKNGGGACLGNSWNRKFFDQLKNELKNEPKVVLAGVCEAKANEICGPFPEKFIEECKAAGGGNACKGDIWSKEFYQKIKVRVDNKNNNPPSPTGLGAKYAASARNGALGYFAGRCYEFVWNALSRVVGPGLANQSSAGATSAYMFADWGVANPGELSRIFGLKRSYVSAPSAPVGSVIVWDAGQCGFNAKHGHIEIVTSPGVACSDGCAPIRTGCSPWVFAPQ